MRGWRKIISNRGFDLLIFTAAALLFNWPLLSVADAVSLRTSHGYLFWTWGGILGLLYLWLRKAGSRPARDLGDQD